MTRKKRQQWETKTLERVRKHLRFNLAILRLLAEQEREEIETQVMAEIQNAVAETSDHTIEESRWLSSFDSEASVLALNILQEQDMKRDFNRSF